MHVKIGELAMKKKMVKAPDQTPAAVPAEQIEKYFRQSQELNRQVRLGWQGSGQGLSLGQLQDFLEHRNPFPQSPEERCANSALATWILGGGKVVVAVDVATVWKSEVIIAPVRYKESTLRQAAEENKFGQADWRLVFCLGNSLRYQREIRGTDTDPAKQPCFNKNNAWWKEENFAARQNQAGYYLIDFKGRWQDLTWHVQERELQSLGPQYERTDPAIFSEAILTICMIGRENVCMIGRENVVENWYYWSGQVNFEGHFIYIGLDVGGLRINAFRGGYSGSNLRVCLCRKFDA